MFHQDLLRANLDETLPVSRQPFQCQNCGKQYNTQLGFKRHLVTSHSTAAGLSCIKESPSLLENLSDQSERPPSSEGCSSVPLRERKYSCERCDRRFYTRKDVRRHAVVHTGRRDFLCPCCAQRFGRRDHLTRHLKKSHAQDSGLMSPCPPNNNGATITPAGHCSVKGEQSPVTSAAASTSKDPVDTFVMDMCSSFTPPSPLPGLGHPHGLMQGSLSSNVGHHVSPEPAHPYHHPLQPPSASQQQSFSTMPRYQHGSTSYHRSEVESFLMDLQNAPSPHLSAVSSTTSASPKREVLGDGVNAGGDTHLLSRSSVLSTPELSCTTNRDIGPLLSFLPFSLPPYSPQMSMGSLVMSYPHAPSTAASPSALPGLPPQPPRPFTYFQTPQGPGVQGHGQLPQSYSPDMSASSSIPPYYQTFQQ